MCGDPSWTVFSPTCRITPPGLFSISDQFRVCAVKVLAPRSWSETEPIYGLDLAGGVWAPGSASFRVAERQRRTWTVCGRRSGVTRNTKALGSGSEDSLRHGPPNGKLHLPQSLNSALSRRSAGANSYQGNIPQQPRSRITWPGLVTWLVPPPHLRDQVWCLFSSTRRWRLPRLRIIWRVRAVTAAPTETPQLSPRPVEK